MLEVQSRSIGIELTPNHSLSCQCHVFLVPRNSMSMRGSAWTVYCFHGAVAGCTVESMSSVIELLASVVWFGCLLAMVGAPSLRLGSQTWWAVGWIRPVVRGRLFEPMWLPLSCALRSAAS